MEKKKLYYSEGDNRQYHIGVREGEVGRYVLLPGDPKRCAKIAAYFDDAKLVADVREFVTYTGYIDGVKVSVTSTGIGGPSAAIAMEELTNCGADTFIRVGTCGGIALQVKGGDLVIANSAVRMEGTSREYAPIEYPAAADFDVTLALRDAAIKLGYPYHVGVVQCKDSFYGQHDPERMPYGTELIQKWEAWKRLGCLASEMESAALYIVAASLGVRAGTILRTVANQERRAAGLDNELFDSNTQTAIPTAIEAIRLLIQRDSTS